MNTAAVLLAMSPEHLLLAGIVVLIILEIVADESPAALPISVVFVAAAAAAAAALGFSGWTGAPFPGQIVLTPPTAFAKAIILALAVPVLLFSRDDFGKGAFYPLLLSSLYGVCLLASADSFLTLFLGIELMSIPVYVLVLIGLNRRPESAEAALKYLVLSGTASASFLMGASLIYGSTGSLGLASFALALGSPGPRCAGTAVVMVVTAFFLKAAIVPVPRLGAGRLRGREHPVDRLHGDDREGGCAGGRRARLRHRARRRAAREPARHPAARLHRLGQPHGDAPAGAAPHDRVLVDRARGLPLLRVPRATGPGASRR